VNFLETMPVPLCDLDEMGRQISEGLPLEGDRRHQPVAERLVLGESALAVGVLFPSLELDGVRGRLGDNLRFQGFRDALIQTGTVQVNSRPQMLRRLLRRPFLSTFIVEIVEIDAFGRPWNGGFARGMEDGC